MVIKKSTHWEGAPNINANAAINEIRKVKGKLAIEVTAAYIRKAKVNGVFEIANTEMPFRIKKGELTVEVICFWHGKKPKTTWTHLILSKKYKLITSHTGEVTANIGAV
jgi:hypothetical protein